MKRKFGLMSMIGLCLAYLYGTGLAWFYEFENILAYFKTVEFDGLYFWIMLLPMIVIWFVTVLFSTHQIKEDYGDARWATTKDINNMDIDMFAKDGMVLGIWQDKFIRTNQTLSTVVAAPPGTGKTVAVAIPNLLTCSWSMIVNDVKNELWELTSLHRQKFQKVIRFAPTEKGSSCWNPFNELPDSFGEQLIFLNRISSVIYPTTGDPDKDHWPLSARTLFTFFALVAILGNEDTGDNQDTVNNNDNQDAGDNDDTGDTGDTGDNKDIEYNQDTSNNQDAVDNDNTIDIESSRDKLTFFSIRKTILSTEDIQGFAADYIDDFKATSDKYLNNFIQENVNSILQFSEKEFGSVVSTTKTALEVFNDPYIQQSMATSDFNIRELRESKLTIYLSSNMKDSERVQPITRLFIELATVELLSDKPTNDQKVLILADEFVKMGKMTQLIKAPDLSRGQKLAVIFIMQSLSQPVEVYGAEVTKTLVSTTAFKVVFTQLSADTMKEISNLIGTETIKKANESRKNKFAGGGIESVSLSESGEPLIRPQDVGALKSDEVLIIVQGYNTRPIKAKSCRWFKVDSMKHLVVENEASG
jgi:type IV secretion system protein VirD4